MYTVQFTKAAHRVFKKLPTDVQSTIKEKLTVLQVDPLAGAPLKGIYRTHRSLHISYKAVAYRAIYQVFPTLNSIIIYLADKRENIYKRLEEMKI